MKFSLLHLLILVPLIALPLVMLMYPTKAVEILTSDIGGLLVLLAVALGLANKFKYRFFCRAFAAVVILYFAATFIWSINPYNSTLSFQGTTSILAEETFALFHPQYRAAGESIASCRRDTAFDDIAADLSAARSSFQDSNGPFPMPPSDPPDTQLDRYLPGRFENVFYWVLTFGLASLLGLICQVKSGDQKGEYSGTQSNLNQVESNLDADKSL